MSKEIMCLVIAVFIGVQPTIVVRYTLQVEGYDLSGRGTSTYIELSSGESIVLREGEGWSLDTAVAGVCTVTRRAEIGWSHLPVKPTRRVSLSWRRWIATKPKVFVMMAVIGVNRRKIILNYPPASSVWHLPMGIAQLAPILRSAGHEVIQRYGHIIGLEHVLRQYGGAEIDTALAAVRDPKSDIHSWYQARMAFERVSRSVPTPDKFVVERNNVRYVCADYDGSIEGVMRAVRHRESNMWYQYFVNVELPIVRDAQPDVYGISISDEKQLIPCCILASLVKDTSPSTFVVLGGNFWSRVMSAFTHPEGHQLFDLCDAIVYREGFQPIKELVEALTPSVASGTVWRNNDRVVINPPSLIAMPFESLPTPEFNGGTRQWSPDDVYPLYTMSNCPMACGFCAISAGSDTYLKKPRMISPERVAEHMVALGTHRFDVVDETFMVQRQLAVGDALRRHGYSATWHCYLTVTNDLLDANLCRRLADAGLRGVQLGLESLSPETLKREHKGWNTPANYWRILENLRNAGIQTHVFIIVGIPGEPLTDALRWIPFLEECGDSILTIKSGRYRLTHMSPEEQHGTHSALIEVAPNTKPLHLNSDFRYRSNPQNISRKRVEAMRTILERACRDHWAYAATSTIPWWINRGMYAWEELCIMAQELSEEKEVPHLDDAVTRVHGIILDELGKEVQCASYDDVRDFAHTI